MAFRWPYGGLTAAFRRPSGGLPAREVPVSVAQGAAGRGKEWIFKVVSGVVLMVPASAQAIHAGGLFLWMAPASPFQPRRRPVFVDSPCRKPGPSTLEGCFCGWPQPGAQAIHAGGLFLWMAPLTLTYSFRFMSKLFRSHP